MPPCSLGRMPCSFDRRLARSRLRPARLLPVKRVLLHPPEHAAAERVLLLRRRREPPQRHPHGMEGTSQIEAGYVDTRCWEWKAGHRRLKLVTATLNFAPAGSGSQRLAKWNRPDQLLGFGLAEEWLGLGCRGGYGRPRRPKRHHRRHQDQQVRHQADDPQPAPTERRAAGPDQG
jgi:hypothetical protein